MIGGMRSLPQAFLSTPPQGPGRRTDFFFFRTRENPPDTAPMIARRPGHREERTLPRHRG